MARIPVYLSKQPIPQAKPIVVNPNTFSGAAEGVSALGKQVGVLEERLKQKKTNQQISQMSADAATAQAELSTQWEHVKNTADPNDPDVGKKFYDEVVQPRLDQIAQTATTDDAKNHAIRLTAAMKGDFIRSTAEGQAELAGVAAVQNHLTTRNQLSTAAEADPFNLDHLLAMSTTAIDALRAQGNIDPKQLAKLQEEDQSSIVAGAVLGKIDRNPAQAAKDVASGMYDNYIDGAQKEKLIRAAEERQKSDLAEARANQSYALQNQRIEGEKAASKIINSLIDPDTGAINVPPDAFKALLDPKLDTPGAAGLKQSMFTFLETRLNAQKTQGTNPAVFEDLRRRSALGPDDPDHLTVQDLLKAAGSGDISSTDFKTLKSYMDFSQSQGSKFEMSQVKEVINGMKTAVTGRSDITGVDSEGDQRFAAFSREAMDAYVRGRENNIPHADLINPKSQYYIGNIAQGYILNPRQKMDSMQNNLTTGTTVYHGPIGKGEPGSSPSNPVLVKNRADAAKVPMFHWFKTPDGQVIQRLK